MRRALRLTLEPEADIEIVGEAVDGQAAVEMVRSHCPDVVLMDIRMPKLDGIEATRRLTDGPEPTKILVLTAFDSDEHLVAALRAGAVGFLSKDADPDELIQGIRQVAVGDAVIAPSATRRLLRLFAHQMPSLPPPGADLLETLTDRELEILVLVTKGLSNTEIARSLHLAETTVKGHVGRLLAKLQLQDRVHLVIFAYEHNIVRP